MSPALGAGHRLPAARALAQAATAAGADAEVPGVVSVAMPGGKLLVHDAVVAAGEAAGELAGEAAGRESAAGRTLRRWAGLHAVMQEDRENARRPADLVRFPAV